MYRILLARPSDISHFQHKANIPLHRASKAAAHAFGSFVHRLPFSSSLWPHFAIERILRKAKIFAKHHPHMNNRCGSSCTLHRKLNIRMVRLLLFKQIHFHIIMNASLSTSNNGRPQNMRFN